MWQKLYSLSVLRRGRKYGGYGLNMKTYEEIVRDIKQSFCEMGKGSLDTVFDRDVEIQIRAIAIKIYKLQYDLKKTKSTDNKLIYPFMNKTMFVPVPQGNFDKYVVSCDYGTINPSSFGLWGLMKNVWFRIDEYYYDSRKEGFQKTDEEHYEALCRLAGDKKIEKVVIDPSAASFIQTVRRNGRFAVVPAENKVIDGIRKVSTVLKNKSVRICVNCKDSMREFNLYRWNSAGEDAPVKENDHAMDDIRYFVSTVL